MNSWQIICAVVAYFLIGFEMGIVSLRNCNKYKDSAGLFMFASFVWPVLMFALLCTGVPWHRFFHARLLRHLVTRHHEKPVTHE